MCIFLMSGAPIPIFSTLSLNPATQITMKLPVTPTKKVRYENTRTTFVKTKWVCLSWLCIEKLKVIVLLVSFLKNKSEKFLQCTHTHTYIYVIHWFIFVTVLFFLLRTEIWNMNAIWRNICLWDFSSCYGQYVGGPWSVRCYVDDVLIWGAALQEHDDRLSKVLQRVRENGLKAELFQHFWVTARGVDGAMGMINIIGWFVYSKPVNKPSNVVRTPALGELLHDATENHETEWAALTATLTTAPVEAYYEAEEGFLSWWMENHSKRRGWGWKLGCWVSKRNIKETGVWAHKRKIEFSSFELVERDTHSGTLLECVI